MTSTRWRMRAVRLLTIGLTIGLTIVVSEAGRAQSAPSSVLGEWHGRSTCLVKPSACHDEVVVYEIRRDSVFADTLVMKADKIVNGARDWMGDLRCGWHAPTLACPIRGAVWRFTQHGDSLAGVLDLADGRRFREVEARKVTAK